MIFFEYDLLFHTLQAHNACTKICLDLRIQHFYFLLWEFLRILYKPDGAHYCRRNLQFLSFTYCNECRNVLQKDQMAEQREVINSLCASLKKGAWQKLSGCFFNAKFNTVPQNSILLWYQKGIWQATLEFHLANTFDTNLLSSSIPNSHSAIRPKSPDLNYIFGTFSYLEPES